MKGFKGLNERGKKNKSRSYHFLHLLYSESGRRTDTRSKHMLSSYILFRLDFFEEFSDHRELMTRVCLTDTDTDTDTEINTSPTWLSASGH